MPLLERAAYGAYGAFRFTSEGPRDRRDLSSDRNDPGRPAPNAPGTFLILPTVVKVGCAEHLSIDEAAAGVGAERFSRTRWIYLADFRPPSPAGQRTLYLTADEARAIHHFLGLDVVYEPPLGPIAVAPLSYPDAGARFDWLRRALPIAHRTFGGVHVLTPPTVDRIVLDATLARAVIDFHGTPTYGGSVELTSDGGAWRVATWLGDWIE